MVVPPDSDSLGSLGNCYLGGAWLIWVDLPWCIHDAGCIISDVRLFPLLLSQLTSTIISIDLYYYLN